jgi:hypothetical protein
LGSFPEPLNGNTNVPGRDAEPQTRTPRSRRPPAEPHIKASHRPLSLRLRAARRSKSDVGQIGWERPGKVHTPSTRPKPESDRMLMSPIRKAGGRRSPSNNREGERYTQKPAPQANKRLRMSEGIGTLDDGRRFDDLPLLSKKGGDKSEDESEDEITEFRGRTAKSRTEKASDTRNRRRTVEKDTTDERTLSKYLPPTSLTSSEDPLTAPTVVDGSDQGCV